MADDASLKGDLATEAAKGAVPATVPAKPKLVVAKSEQNRVVPSEEANKVVHIVRRLAEETSQSRVLRRSPWVLISIIACVVLPTIIAALFYLLIASDRFVSEARFAIRNNETQGIDALGLLTGMPTSQVTSDSYIVADYVASRDMVQELERRLPFRAIFANADYFSRLSPDATLEDLVSYWERHVDVFFDSTKNTVVVEVQAFTASDADRLAREIVDIVRSLVNDLSAQARRDAVQFAASEVARAELRVRGARDDILQFRLTHNDLDPTMTAQSTLSIAAGLEAERSKLLSDLASVSGYLSDDAPSVQMLRSRIDALAGEISRIQGQVSAGADSTAGGLGVRSAKGGNSDALANTVGAYQELVLSQEFAEKAYTAAMGSLEHARMEAARTQSYLAIYGQPNVAEEAAYPRRWLNIWVVLVLASVLWAIGALGVMTVRDHIR